MGVSWRDLTPLDLLVGVGTGTDLGMQLLPTAALKWISAKRAKDPWCLSERAATHFEAGLCTQEQ